MALDLAHVRSQFPALADGFAYFDNAGGSLVLMPGGPNGFQRLSALLQRADRRLLQATSQRATALGCRRRALRSRAT